MAARLACLPLRSLPDETARCLRRLVEAPLSERFYLAGGAALALQLDARGIVHRRPRGLDLMSATDDLKSPRRRDLMAEIVSRSPRVEIETARDGYLYLRFDGDVPVRFYHYPYPSVERPSFVDAGPAADSSRRLDVASLIDLGLMKLGAIISRGTRRDFVDLYLICRQIPFERLLAPAKEKFSRVRDFPLQAMKGLGDRSIAERDPMPRIHPDLSWKSVTDWLDCEVRDSIRRDLGIDHNDT